MQKTFPLSGIRVLDLGWFIPGPFCSLLLSDMGAEVIKIERPGGGDPLRGISDAYFTVLNRNKKSVAIDLKDPEARDCFARLVETADVFIEGFRPGVATRLGLDYPGLSRVNPKLVYASISGFGQTGPRRLDPGHDINFLATAGILSVPGHVGQAPRRPGLPLGDLAGGQYAVSAITGALFSRERTGSGSYLDIGMAEVALYLAQVRFADYLTHDGQWLHTTPLNDIFTTSDGGAVAISFGVPGEEKFIESLFRYANEPFDIAEYQSGPGKRLDQDKLTPVVAKLIRSRRTAEWAALLPSGEVPLSPVNSPEQALQEPHFAARSIVRECALFDSGASLPVVVAPGSDAAWVDCRPAPRLGAHTFDLLSGCGIAPDRIRQLATRNILAI